MSFSKWRFCYEMFPLYKPQTTHPNSFPSHAKEASVFSLGQVHPPLGHIFLYKQGIAPLFRMNHWTSSLVILLVHLITRLWNIFERLWRREAVQPSPLMCFWSMFWGDVQLVINYFAIIVDLSNLEGYSKTRRISIHCLWFSY